MGREYERNPKGGERMTIYIDNGDTVKVYPVKVKIAKAVETLLESNCELVWSETLKGYGVKIIDKERNE